MKLRNLLKFGIPVLLFLGLSQAAHAASYYRCANGNWDAINTWSLVSTTTACTSATAPTASDDCIFDSGTPNGTTTINVAATCVNLYLDGTGGNASPWAGTMAGSSGLAVSGNINRSGSEAGWTYSGTITFNATSGTQTLTSNGKIYAGPLTQNGAGGKVLLADALNMGSKVYTLSAGIFDTGNNSGGGNVGGFNVTMGQLLASSGGTRVVYFNASTLTFIVPSGGAITVIMNSGATFDLGHSTVELQNNSNTVGTKGLSTSLTGWWNIVYSGSGSSAGPGLSLVINNNLTITNTGGSVVSGGPTLMTVMGSLDASTATATPTLGTQGWNVAGNVTLGAGVTLGGSGQLTLNGTGTQLITSAGKTWPGTVTQNGSGGTVSLQDAFATASTFTLTNGTINTNGFNVTSTTFVTAAGTKTLSLNGSLWTVTATGNAVNNAANTGFTVTANTGTFKHTNATSSTFAGGGKSWGGATVWASSGAGVVTITGANTLNLRLDAANTITLPASTTTTCATSNCITSAGTSGSHALINSSSGGTKATLSFASGCIGAGFTDITDNTATGGATWYSNGTLTSTTGWLAGACPVTVPSPYAQVYEDD